jgi:hypothetical protein
LSIAVLAWAGVSVLRWDFIISAVNKATGLKIAMKFEWEKFNQLQHTAYGSSFGTFSSQIYQIT